MLGQDDGRDACKSLKSDPKFQHLPVILMSGIHNFHIQHTENPIFADDYIDKPFSNCDILEKISIQLLDED